MNAQAQTQAQPKNQIAIMAERLSIDSNELYGIVLNTVMPTGNKVPQVTNEQFVSFLAVANEYGLNPLTKEIYAFPTKAGGVQPIVSIDGWLKIINDHPNFDGMEFKDQVDSNGKLISITCQIHRKDRKHPTEVTEYMNECAGTSEPWKKWPARMLRHKAAIQAARYAFGFSGIADPDEGERIKSVQEKDVTPANDSAKAIEYYPADRFETNFPQWKKAVQSGMKTPTDIIAMASSKGALTKDQINQIENIQGAA